MFTKLDEIVYKDNGKTKNIGKRYTYSDDLELSDIIAMVEDSNYNINYVDVSVEDEYTYGQGRQTLEDFKEIYEKLPALESASFVLDDMNARIAVYPERRMACLQFFNVAETPDLEISDILQEKKMSI